MSKVLECPKCDSENNHVKEVILRLGDDSYVFTDSLKVEAVKNEIALSRIITPTEQSKYRLRGELQTCIVLVCEECSQEWRHIVSHHKGCVYVDHEW